MFRNTSRVLCLFVIITLSHGSADSVDQSTDGVCRSNLPAVPGTLSGSQSQLRSTARGVRRSAAQSGSRPLFGSGNATRTEPLRTEPTRTPRNPTPLPRRPLEPSKFSVGMSDTQCNSLPDQSYMLTTNHVNSVENKLPKVFKSYLVFY